MLKKLIALFTVVSVFTTLNAQETEGHVAYTVEFSSKQPEMQMYTGMLQGSKLDMYFADGKSRTEMKVGTMMETVNIVDSKSKKMLTLLSGMMGKKAITETIEKKTDETPKFKVELINETKDIAGYSCKKALITDEEGNKYTFWYTDKIKINTEGQKYFDGYGIPGFPLQMEIGQNGMDIKMVATIFEKLPKKHKLFDMEVPEGYQVMTKEEMEKMMGGM